MKRDMTQILLNKMDIHTMENHIVDGIKGKNVNDNMGIKEPWDHFNNYSNENLYGIFQAEVDFYHSIVMNMRGIADLLENMQVLGKHTDNKRFCLERLHKLADQVDLTKNNVKKLLNP